MSKKERKEVKEITLNENELYVGNLSDGDKFHLLTQYLNNQGAMIRGLLQLNAQILQGIRILVESKGIDWKQAINDLSKRSYEELEKQINEQKEQIKNISKQKSTNTKA